MDFNEILNGTIIELVTAIIIAIVCGIFGLLKKKFKENTRLFMIKFKFYLCLIFILVDTYILGRSTSQYLLWKIFPLLVIIICCIIAFNEALKYNNDNSK